MASRSFERNYLYCYTLIPSTKNKVLYTIIQQTITQKSKKPIHISHYYSSDESQLSSRSILTLTLKLWYRPCIFTPWEDFQKCKFFRFNQILRPISSGLRLFHLPQRSVAQSHTITQILCQDYYSCRNTIIPALRKVNRTRYFGSPEFVNFYSILFLTCLN